MTLDNIEKVLIVSPSSYIKKFDVDFFNQKRESGYYILSFSSSILYLHNIGFVPDGWSFIDPSTWVSCMSKQVLSFIRGRSDLFILDLYRNKGSKFEKCQMTSKNHPLPDTVLDKFKEFRKIYLKEDFNLVEIKDDCTGQTSGEDWTKKCCLYISDKINNKSRYNTDKLACFLLPLLVHFMKHLNKIEALCFWQFNSDRILGRGRNSPGNSYDHYKRSIKIMESEIQYNLSNAKIEFEVIT